MAVDADPRSLTHHVSQALAGDAESFGELVRRYQGGVQGLAYHLTGNFADAQDVVQETFVTAYTRLDQLRDPERFGSWLRTIAHNECGARWRGRRDGLPLDDLPPSAEPADTAGTVDVEMERRETWAHVRRVLARLPESSRLTLTLHYLSDWSYADIAEFLDVPITTVVGRMHRARLLLQERLEPMVRETFQTERLGDARIAAIVAGAIDKAKEANERWERATFLAHTDEALAALDPTSTDPEVARGRVEILGMRGDARATWIGDVLKAVEDYLHAIATADEGGADEDAARLCKELVAAYLRSGQYEPGRNAAENARGRFAALGDSVHEALMVAAADPCDELPGVWAPGDTGGYVMAAFPLRKDVEGITFEAPVSVRNYTWGAPSPSAALAWLLHPSCVLGPHLAVGSSWTGRITEHSGHDLLWRLRDGHELVAVSTVESVSDDVVTPAGRFARCLRVRTEITAPGGRASPDYVGRALGGVRLSWYAPGVGCVKARHDNQNHQVRALALVDCHEPVGEEYLPMQTGVWWRYRWTQGGHGGSDALSIFEDVVRVVAVDDETAFLSSATMAAGESDEAFDSHVDEMLEHERESCDDAGIASFLDMKARRMSPDNRSDRDASARELAAVYERVGDARRAIDARWRLEEIDGKLTPGQAISRARELVAAAEADGSWEARSTASWLLGVALRDAGRGDDAQTAMRAAAGISADAGDVVGAANGESWADRFLFEDTVPPDDMRGYANGEFRLVQEDDVIGGGDSSTCTYHGYPPGPAGTTLTHFPLHRPYSGFRLVDRGLGATHSVRNGLGASWGGESMMATHTVTETSATVSTPCGSFDGCVVIESKHELNVGSTSTHPDKDRVFGYAGGTQRSWFAPDVGLVRVLHEHANGHTSDMLLRSHEVRDGTGLTGLSVGSRWEYACVDQATGTEYEHFVRVAAKIGATWLVVFVTRATATCDG